MAWTFYSSTDASAPTLTGQAGSLTTLLDAVLVNGYGSKPAAGWTIAYTGTSKRAYLMGSGLSPYYMRILDDGTTTAKEAYIVGYRAMTTIDAGTGALATHWIRKSATADSTTRSWYITADDRTVILYLFSADVNLVASTTYFGEFFSFVTNDSYGVCQMGRATQNNATMGLGGSVEPMWTTASTSVQASNSGVFLLGGDSAGIAGASTFELIGNIHCSGVAVGGSINLVGAMPFPAAQDGSMMLSPFYMRSWEGSGTGAKVIRGRLRGCWLPLHTNIVSYLTIGDSFAGINDQAGKTFTYVGQTNTASSVTGVRIAETSDTVARN